MKQNIDNLITIRHHLHEIAELSGKEAKTADYLLEQLKELAPDIIIQNLGGYGIAAVFDTHKPGHTICFRAELDALPIAETNKIKYKSKSHQVSHKCGHDGHATILLGLGQWVKTHLNSLNGRIILLFQPAEETAQGALAVLSDQRFTNLKPDYIFGLHNLPGFSIGSIILRDNVFAAASCGVKIKLIGKTSHAAHPENGNSPLTAMILIMEALSKLPQDLINPEDGAMITIIHVRLGEEAFGTSPGEAEIMATYRAYNNESLDKMTKATEKVVAFIAKSCKLKHKLHWVERFAATANDHQAYDIVNRAAKKMKVEIIQPGSPFLWSEDFSYYSQNFKTAFFGLGAGDKHPQLHNPDYDFPDALIEPGIEVFANILKGVVKAYVTNKLD